MFITTFLQEKLSHDELKKLIRTACLGLTVCVLKERFIMGTSEPRKSVLRSKVKEALRDQDEHSKARTAALNGFFERARTLVGTENQPEAFTEILEELQAIAQPWDNDNFKTAHDLLVFARFENALGKIFT